MESLASIRKACKVPKVQRLTTAEAHQRVRAPAPVVPKPRVVTPPEGRGSELWWALYHDALARGIPEPEKMADSSLRARERAKALEAARPAVKLTLEPPKPQETAVNEKAASKGRVAPLDACRCKALTLEGRRCGFKATCGDFCKKHAQKM
jgi:hypothetical protein